MNLTLVLVRKTKRLHTLNDARGSEAVFVVAEKPLPFLLSTYTVVFGEVGGRAGVDAGAWHVQTLQYLAEGTSLIRNSSSLELRL